MDERERIAKLVVVQVLEDLGGDDGVEGAWQLTQIDRLQRLGVEPGFAQKLAAVLDAARVEVDPGHVEAPRT